LEGEGDKVLAKTAKETHPSLDMLPAKRWQERGERNRKQGNVDWTLRNYFGR